MNEKYVICVSVIKNGNNKIITKHASRKLHTLFTRLID